MKLCVLCIAIVIGCGKPAPKRQYFETKTLPDGSLLVTWESLGYWIGRLDRSAHMMWSTKLEGELQGGPHTRTLVISEDVAGVRTRARAASASSVVAPEQAATAQLEGVDLATGKHLWTTRLEALNDDARSSAGIDIYFPGYASRSSLHPYLTTANLLFQIDARTGREQSRTSVKGMTRAPMKYRGGIILQDAFEALVIDSTAATKVESRGSGCVVGADYWRLVRLPSGHYELRTLDEGSRISIETAGVAPMLVGCATLGEDLVIFLQTSGSDLQSRTEIRVYDRNRQVVRQLTVGELRNSSLTDPPGEASHAFGTLTRFLPLVVNDADGVAKLVMVDLREGRVTWEVPGWVLDHVFRVDGRWYLSRFPRTDLRLRLVALFDGETGQIDRAVEIWGDGVDLREITDNDVGGGSLWVVATQGSSASNSFARLDAATLKKVAGSMRFEIVDATNDQYLSGIPRR